MSKKITRRKFIKNSFSFLFAALGISTGGCLYANKVEPTLLDINQVQISHKKIPSGFQNFKIVQFSDTHLGFQYNLKQFEKLSTTIHSLKPDLIIFTGDLLDKPNHFHEKEKTISILKKLQAPYGKFAIYGNHDHGDYGSSIYKNMMEKSGFRLLRNESQKIQLSSGESIYILGLDDVILGKPNFQSSKRNIPVDAYKILLSHAPDLADQAAAHHIELQLSGHSHGGQIKIPFFGALVKPPYGEKYFEGLYTIGKEYPLTLYVNRGLGTTRLPFRFLSKPEITVFTLNHKS